MKPFVVATDLTAVSEPALRRALRLARETVADVVLVHAWAPFSVAVLDAAVMASPEHVARMTRDAQGALDALLARYRPEHGKLTARLMDGTPPAVVAQVAREVDAEFVFVGTRPHTGLRRLVGSEAEAIIRACPCPVVVVRDDLP